MEQPERVMKLLAVHCAAKGGRQKGIDKNATENENKVTRK